MFAKRVNSSECFTQMATPYSHMCRTHILLRKPQFQLRFALCWCSWKGSNRKTGITDLSEISTNFSAFYSLKTCFQLLCMQIFCSDLVFLLAFCSFSISMEERGRTFRKPTGFHIAFQSSEDQTKNSHLVQFCHSPSRGIYNVIFGGSDAHQAYKRF